MTEKAPMRRVRLVLLGAASVALGACAARRPAAAPPAAPAANEAAQGSGAGSANAAAGADEEAAGPQAGLLATHLVYFDFDSSEIKGEGTDIVAAHAKYLAGHPNARVRLEGHTDERGSREYNIGLGERRAQSVRRAMLLQGASDGQITTVSYGEDRPAAPGPQMTAWAKNRRVEFVYLTPTSQPPQSPKG